MEKPSRRILLISSNSSNRGGGERYLAFMSAGLKELDCEIHVLISTADYMDVWEVELKNAGAIVHRQDLTGLAQRPLRFVSSLLDRRQQKIVSDTCNRIKPDFILVNQQYDEDGLDYIIGALAAKVCPVASVLHMPMTNGKHSRPLGILRGKFLKHWYAKNQHMTVFSSGGSQTEFINYYREANKTCVIHSGIPWNKLTKEITSTKFETDLLFESKDRDALKLPNIGVACQFVPQKNLHSLIEAWQMLFDHGQPARLLLIGDGPDRAELEDRLSGNDASSWYITGWTENYANYIKNLDVFVMPSHFESMPLTLIEAVGMGVPAVIANFHGAQEVAQRAHWVEILSDQKPSTIARAISGCMNKERIINHVDREEFIDYFSPKRMAQDLLTQFSL